MSERFLSKIELNSLTLLHTYCWEVSSILTNIDVGKSDAKEAVVSPEHYLSRFEVDQSAYDITYRPFLSILCFRLVPLAASKSIICIG